MIEELFVQSKKGLLAVGGTVASAITLNQWVALLTGGYVVLQFAYLARKWYREEKEWRVRRRR